MQPPIEADTPRTQAERTAASDRAMIEAAIDLVLERGTDGTTLAAIGERAGYSRGLATYRFGSKAGLFKQVSTTINRRWVSYLRSAVGKKVGIDALCAAADAFYQFVTDAPRDIRLLHILYYEASSPQSELREFAKEAFSRQLADVETWLEGGIKAGSVRKSIDPTVEATKYVAHIAGMTFLWLLGPGKIDFAAVHNEHKRQLNILLAP